MPDSPDPDKRTIRVSVRFSPAALKTITAHAGPAYRRWIADTAEARLATETGFKPTPVHRHRDAKTIPGGTLGDGDVKSIPVTVYMAPRALEAIKAVAGDGTVSRWIADVAEEEAGHVDAARRPARRRKNRSQEAER